MSDYSIAFISNEAITRSYANEFLTEKWPGSFKVASSINSKRLENFKIDFCLIDTSKNFESFYDLKDFSKNIGIKKIIIFHCDNNFDKLKRLMEKQKDRIIFKKVERINSREFFLTKTIVSSFTYDCEAGFNLLIGNQNGGGGPSGINAQLTVEAYVGPCNTNTSFSLQDDNNKITVGSCTCNAKNDGSLALSIEDTKYNYTISVSGVSDPIKISGTNKTANVTGLAKGTYTVCFKVDENPDYEQCFEAVITEPISYLSITFALSSFLKEEIISLRETQALPLTLSNFINANFCGSFIR